MNNQKEYEQTVELLKAAARPEAEKVRQKYIDTHAKKLTESNSNLSMTQAKKVVEDRCKGHLNKQDMLIFDDGERVSVGEVLRNPRKYDNKGARDPLEPEAGKGKAKFFANLDKGTPRIHSFSHGGITYNLDYRKSAEEVCEECLQLMADQNGNLETEQWCSLISNAQLKKPGVKVVIAFLSEKNVGTKRELNNEYKEWANEDIKAKKVQKFKKATGERLGIKYIPDNLHEMLVKTMEGIKKYPGELNCVKFGYHLSYIQYESGKNYFDTEKDSITQDRKLPKIRQYTIDNLPITISQSVCFYNNDRFGTPVPMKIPPEISKGLLSNPNTKAPVVTGLSPHPIILPNGRILNKEGYDEVSQLYMALGGQNFAPLKEQLTKDDAQRSLYKIVELLFSEFDFSEVPEADLDNLKLYELTAVALLLTGLTRKVIDTAPAFLVNANVQGSGKTTLARMCYIILTGADMPVHSMPGYNDEAKKEMLSILAQSPSMVCFDNALDGSELKGQILAQVITSSSFSSRLLGQSKEMTAPTNTAFVVTGNNLSLSEDYIRRFISIVLGAKTEEPEKRVFKRPHIVRHCRSCREEVIKHCLTIIKVYIDAGKPVNPEEHCGSGFPEWDQMVRFPLLYATGIDVVKTMDLNRQKSSEHTAASGLLRSLYEKYGSTSFKSRELYDYVKEYQEAFHNNIDDPLKDDLRDAIVELNGDALRSSRKLSWVLKQKRDRPTNGLVLKYHANNKGNQGRYWIDVIDKEKVSDITPREEIILAPIEPVVGFKV